MADSRASRLAAGAHQWARLALGLLLIGPSILLVYAWVEVLNNPGYTLADGYWIGRTPWTPLGLIIGLVGAVAGLLAGSVAIAIEGGWWRRFLIVPSLGAAAAWWLTALGALPYPRFVGPDPITFAYTLPVATTLLLLMPAGLLATLCLSPPIVREPRTRLRPVPSREPWSEPPPEVD
ncbi:MAG TPA: hypothetical protein VLA62_04150 [Solirubrobacterales bacterium]|nr:hypothetical protein [Solirubrobacterales bacterium]